jgi:SAM-dependent methyltransferase
MSEYKKRTKCAICGGEEFVTVLNYGEVSLAGFFPKEDQLNNIKTYELSLLYCPTCHLLQSNSIVEADYLFKDYRYLSSVSLQKHFNEYSKYLIEYFNLNSNSKVLEIGSNDGVLLKPLNDSGILAKGFEPSDNVSKIAIDRGCDIIHDYFNFENAQKYCVKNSFDLITASNTFAHVDDIQSVVKGIHYALKEDGCFIFEVHYGKNIIEELQYDNVYHEHIYYYTVTALKYLFDMNNMTIVNVDEIPLHSGSIRVIVFNKVEPVNEKIVQVLEKEKLLGVDTPKYYDDFKNRVLIHQHELYKCLIGIKNKGYNIAGYGASGRANMLCNFNNIDNTLIDYIIDESPERYGRYINNIPILSSDKLNINTDYIVIFAWNYSKMIISKLINNYDFTYIIPFPDIRIINRIDEIEDINTL